MKKVGGVGWIATVVLLSIMLIKAWTKVPPKGDEMEKIEKRLEKIEKRLTGIEIQQMGLAKEE